MKINKSCWITISEYLTTILMNSLTNRKFNKCHSNLAVSYIHTRMTLESCSQIKFGSVDPQSSIMQCRRSASPVTKTKARPNSNSFGARVVEICGSIRVHFQMMKVYNQWSGLLQGKYARTQLRSMKQNKKPW